ncbi:MAG TPA: tRNA (adenosine(37)-N6)-dimethylallyltransferase MiaA, partial [Geminicoccaceae bacterium]|nr:tRNA (adenosine(37)-N6)-dimethylallyltransferase MiaA [Geminicoccaceae bacterium]
PALSAIAARAARRTAVPAAGLIVLGGPTASGKSAYALALAEALGGVVVNADSMQVYRELRVVTARPGPAEEARAPHRLYGVLRATEPCSAGRWLAMAEAAIGEAAGEGRPAVVVGGTGLYLKALLHGLAPVPDVPPAVRAEAEALHARLGGAAFRARLAERDPAMAARLRPSDRQRLVRAYEVVAATGRSLAAWQAEAPPRRARLPGRRVGLALTPPRAELYARIGRRLRAMIAAGGLDEVRALAALGLDPGLPLMKAVAVPELLDFVAGRTDLEGALARAATSTRRYAKRQLTWLRHQLPELTPLPAFGDAAAGLPDAAALRRALLTTS